MTEISRSIEIAAPRDQVWAYIQPENWTKIFDFVREVDGYTDGRPGVGTRARVVAGADAQSTVQYNVEITEFKAPERIVYRRYGGPLSGKGVIEVKPLQKGTLFVRTSYYEDDLSESTIEMLSTNLERDNRKIRRNIEHAVLRRASSR